MKKKQIFSYPGLFLFLICLIFISGCGNKNQTEKENQTNNSETLVADGEENQATKIDQSKLINQDQKNLANLASEKVKIRKTSINKINSDLREGKITEKEAVKLRLTALVNPEELDDNYKGEEIEGRSSLNSDTKWILNNWDNFSEDEKKEFEPYILPPDEEGSIFYGEDKDLSGLFIKRARAASPNWKSREVNLGAEAKLFYKQKSSWSQSRKNKEEDRSIYLELALEDSWPKFKNLLGTEPEERVYVYLVKMNDCGEAFMKYKDGAQRCIINIKADQSEKLLKASLAHELFHCFQYRLSNKYLNISNDIDWLAEGTAVWAEDHVYSDYNSEHQYLTEDFFKYLDEDLITSIDDREYGRYMWFYFLSQYYDDSYVVKILKKAANNNIRESAQNSVPEYKLAYQDYAFYNWNYGPFFKYKDEPKFPEGEHPRGSASKYFTVFEEQDRDYEADLDKGGMEYRIYSFNPAKQAKYASFKFEDYPEDITITALLKKSEGWQKESWNQLNKKNICLADDETTMIVLIVANSNLKNKNKLKYNLKLEAKCPKISRGTMILEEESSGGSNHRKVTMKSEDLLEYNAETNCMEIVERSISCNINSNIEMMQGTPMHTKSTVQGQGRVSETYYNQEDKPARICFNSDRTTFILDPDTKDDSYIDMTTTLTGNEPRTEKTSCPGLWPTNHIIDPKNISENKIQGKEIFSEQGMTGPISLKIKYDYVFYKKN